MLFALKVSTGQTIFLQVNLALKGQEDVKKLKNKSGVSSVLKKVAPGCPINDRWGIGVHFASNQKPRKFC
jgi:hypothetical protein